MNEMTITLSPTILIGAVLAISGFVVAIDKLVAVVASWVGKAKEPEKKQDQSINELRESNKRISALLDRDDKRLRVLEDGVGVLIKGQMALLGHAVDGNNEHECKEARKDINHYLITK